MRHDYTLHRTSRTPRHTTHVDLIAAELLIALLRINASIEFVEYVIWHTYVRWGRTHRRHQHSTPLGMRAWKANGKRRRRSNIRSISEHASHQVHVVCQWMFMCMFFGCVCDMRCIILIQNDSVWLLWFSCRVVVLNVTSRNLWDF